MAVFPKFKIARRLSLMAFTAWLRTKSARTKVGTSGCEDNCPLAKFLTQTTGVPYQVDGDTAVPALMEDGKVVKDEYGDIEYDTNNGIDLPAWAQDFIKQVDSIDGDTVSAQRALSIVESTTLGRAARMG